MVCNHFKDLFHHVQFLQLQWLYEVMAFWLIFAADASLPSVASGSFNDLPPGVTCIELCWLFQDMPIWSDMPEFHHTLHHIHDHGDRWPVFHGTWVLDKTLCLNYNRKVTSLGSTFHLGRTKFDPLPESHIANAKISWTVGNSRTLRKALAVSQIRFWCAPMLSVKAPGASNILAKAYRNPPKECCQMMSNASLSFFFSISVAVFVVASFSSFCSSNFAVCVKQLS